MDLELLYSLALVGVSWVHFFVKVILHQLLLDLYQLQLDHLNDCSLNLVFCHYLYYIEHHLQLKIVMITVKASFLMHSNYLIYCLR